MTKKRTFELEGNCEHGVGTKEAVPLPLKVEVLDCSETENRSQWVVWLNSVTSEGNVWHLVTVAHPTNCKRMAEIQAAAFRSLLSTPEGESQVIKYVKHSWGEKEHAEELIRMQ